MRTALLVLGVGLAAALLASLGSFVLAVRPPRLAIPGTPADHGLAADSVRITAADGTALGAWYVARPGAPTVVLLHGYPANKADLLPLAAGLAPRFAVLLVDLRYFGESGGRVTTLGVREADDLRRVVDWLEARGSGPAREVAELKVGLFGFSLGGAIALRAAAEDQRIRAVASWAAFADLRALGEDLYAWLGPAKRPWLELLLLWGRAILGVDLASVSPAAAAGRIRAPVLLVHGRGDDQIPFHHAERLEAALRPAGRLETVFYAGGGHGQPPERFTERLADFFARALGPLRTPGTPRAPGG